VDNSGTRTWALHDALGSVRQSLDDTGTPLVASDLAYSPFGLPQSGATPEPFGFTGELHHNDLVYLRARWYDAGAGTFTSVDPFDGFQRMPYSLHPYQYAYSAPTMWTDPSGRCVPEWISGGEPGCTLSAGIGQGRAGARRSAGQHRQPLCVWR
jgi:RHS repeat-associated protein